MDPDIYEKRKKRHIETGKRAFKRMKNRMISKRAGFDLIDKSYNVREDTKKLSKHRSTLHELAATKVMHLGMKLGYKAYSEVIFVNNMGIADVYLPEILTVYELLDSETMVQFKEKIKKYPKQLEIIPLKVEDVLKEDFCL